MSREEVARQLEWSTSTLFRIETGRSRPQPSLGRPSVPGEVKSGHVEVDRGADQFGQDGREVLLQEQPRGRS
jgi:hypothetical protein